MQGVYNPAIAYFEDEKMVGFEYLFLKLPPKTLHEYLASEGEEPFNGHYQQAPTLYYGGSVFFAFFTHTSMAMLMNGVIKKKTDRSIDIHVICKGFREFNEKDKVPEDKKGEDMPWILDTDDANNIKVFVESVLDCESFLHASSQRCQGKPLRRIVVLLLEKGHFELFGWDRLYDETGAFVKDVLYIMSTMLGGNFTMDTKIHEKITGEFKRAMIGRGMIDDKVKTISDLKCREKYRETVMYADDVWCVLATGFSLLLLANVVDIENWNAANLDKSFWEYSRSGYAKFESGLITKITDTVNGGGRIWISPALQAKHVNIDDVYLIAADKHDNKSKLTFDWDSGWNQVAL
jgi:hypothetical protein